VLASLVGYVVLLFVVGGFTYRTWVFDGVVAAGMTLAGVGWATGDRVALPIVALAVGILWFGFTRAEFRFRGSDRLAVKPGDRLPALTAVTVEGAQVSERDLTANGPALLTLYRGWWCPTSKVQVDAILTQNDALVEAGVAVFAGSVDGPEEARLIQEHVGEAIVILCDIPETFLDEIGLRDRRGPRGTTVSCSGQPSNPFPCQRCFSSTRMAVSYQPIGRLGSMMGALSLRSRLGCRPEHTGRTTARVGCY